MPIKKPTRSQLQQFAKDQHSVLALEELFAASDTNADDIATVASDLTTGLAAVKSFVAGDIVWSAAATRAGAVPANGASLLRAGTYAALFAAIGTTYGAVDGTHFNVPDITGRVVAGKEATATRLTAAKSGVDGATLGAVAPPGAQEHTLTEAQMPAHDHSPYSTSDPGTHTHPQATSTLTNSGSSWIIGADGQGGTGGTTQGGGAHTHTVTATSKGSGSAHPNVQPTIVLNAFIIY
ncbi:MAG: tail fiber protein [Elusimicrobiota bacterium]|jgi:microcystin-dependent protein